MKIQTLLTKKHTLFIIKLCFGLVLLTFLCSYVDRKVLSATIERVHVGWTFVFILSFYFLMIYQSILFGYIVSPFAKISPLNLFVFNYIGRFFSFFLPSSIGGDIIKGWYLYPYFTRRANAFAGILFHRVLGGVATIVIALVASMYYLPDNYQKPIAIATVTFLILSCIVGLILIFNYKNLIRLLQLIRKAGSHSYFFGIVHSVLDAVLAYRHHKVILWKTLLLSIVPVLLIPALYILASMALRINLSYGQAIIGTSAALLLLFIPITPGGIGVSEGAFVVGAEIMGVTRENAISIALFARVMNYLCVAPAGLIYIYLPMPHGKILSADSTKGL